MRQLVAGLLFALVLPAFADGAAQSITLDVQNMTCASCPITVRQVLKRQPGVEDAKVDLRSHSAEVKFDPARARPEQLAKALSEAGFPTSLRR